MHAAQAVQYLAEVQPDLRLAKAAARLSHAPDQPLQVSCRGLGKQHTQKQSLHARVAELLCREATAGSISIFQRPPKLL